MVDFKKGSKVIVNRVAAGNGGTTVIDKPKKGIIVELADKFGWFTVFANGVYINEESITRTGRHYLKASDMELEVR